MQFYLIFVISALIGYTQAGRCQLKDLPEVALKCLVKTNATEIDIIDLLSLNEARGEPGKCFRSCMMIDCEFMNENAIPIPEFAKISGQFLGAGDPERTQVIETAVDYCVQDTKSKGDNCNFVEDLFICTIANCKDCQITVPKLQR